MKSNFGNCISRWERQGNKINWLILVINILRLLISLRLLYMDPVKNPFSPWAGTPPPALMGRTQFIDEFKTGLNRTLACRPWQSIMPVWLRWVWKTVLLNHLIDIAEKQWVKTSLIETPEDSDFPRIIINESRKLLLNLDKNWAVSEKVKYALRVLKSFSLSFWWIEAKIDLDPEAWVADSGIFENDIRDMFVALWEAAKSRNTAVLIAIDEVQYLSENYFSALISAIHRTVQLQLPIMVVGTWLPQILWLAWNAKSYAERLFRFPRIDPLNKEEAMLAIRNPIEEQGMQIDQDALDSIFEVSHGYPYFLQEWWYAAWNHSDGPRISQQDIIDLYEIVLSKLDSNFFRVRYDRLTPSERKYLRAMSELWPWPHRSWDIAKKYWAKVESTAPIRSMLISKGMIYSPAHGDTWFTVPMFDEFMKRIMPKWPPGHVE